MKRTLLAVGVAVLISMMLVPVERTQFSFFINRDYTEKIMRPFFLLTNCRCRVQWTPFTLQTAFAAVAAAVIVNLFPRRPRK